MTGLIDLRRDASAIARGALASLDAKSIVGQSVRDAVGDVEVDVVAVGKSAREMTAAVRDAGVRVRRHVIVCDAAAAAVAPIDSAVHVGEHPIPGVGSIEAGRAVIDFLETAPDSGVTVFLVSGGGSSLCCAPSPPVRHDDLVALWHAALAAGLDIGELNAIRSATSAIAGGLVRRHVRTPSSLAFVCVDNVITGAPGTASGLTYDVPGDETVVRALLERTSLANTDCAARLLAAVGPRNARLEVPAVPHDNVVVATPGTLLAAARARADDLGYAVVDLGAELHGDVQDVAAMVVDTVARAPRGRACILGAGESTVRVVASGHGGRCQHLALTLAPLLGSRAELVAAVALASDGSDHVPGVGGAWVDSTTAERAFARGLDIADALARCDSLPTLRNLNQLVDGGTTGWNLCDLIVVCVDAN